VIDMVAAGETLVLDPDVCFSYRRHTESAGNWRSLGLTGLDILVSRQGVDRTPPGLSL